MKLEFCLVCNPHKSFPYKMINGQIDACCSEECWNNGAISLRRSILESEMLLKKSSEQKGLKYVWCYLFAGWKLSKEDKLEINNKILNYFPSWDR